jgi:hypothetical protein
VTAGIGGLASVVQQQRKIEHQRIFEFLKDFSIVLQFRVLGIDDLIEFFDADERVLVGGVTMKKLVLHQTRELAKFRDVTPEKIDAVHGAENRANLAFAGADGAERFTNGFRVLKRPIDQVQSPSHQQFEFGTEPELPLLKMLEEAHHPAGILVEKIARLVINAAISTVESVEVFDVRGWRLFL